MRLQEAFTSWPGVRPERAPAGIRVLIDVSCGSAQAVPPYTSNANTMLKPAAAIRELDERVMDLAGAFRFRRAYIDGVPVPVRVRVPVTLRVRPDR